VSEIIYRFGMDESSAVTTPVAMGTRLEATVDTDEDFDSRIYQSAIGSLMYAMLGTRPDIAYAVSMLGQFSINPSTTHWAAVKRVFRYLGGTMHQTLVFDGNEDKIGLHGYCDSGHAGDLETRKCTSGYVCFLSGAAISWSSRKQRTVALSTTEAEYMAITEARKEIVWLQRLLQEIGRVPESNGPTSLLLSDNQGAISLAKNPKFHQRTKHIDTRYHFIRELVKMNVVNLEYCPTTEMVADCLTKAMPKASHEEGMVGIGLMG
jgi:hypothetical protein